MAIVLARVGKNVSGISFVLCSKTYVMFVYESMQSLTGMTVLKGIVGDVRSWACVQNWNTTPDVCYVFPGMTLHSCDINSNVDVVSLAFLRIFSECIFAKIIDSGLMFVIDSRNVYMWYCGVFACYDSMIHDKIVIYIATNLCFHKCFIWFTSIDVKNNSFAVAMMYWFLIILFSCWRRIIGDCWMKS